MERIRTFFSGDKWLIGAGIKIEEAGEGYALCSLEIEPGHLNASGVIQGGATYTLADSAFAVACNAADIESGDIKRRVTVSQSATISYLKPPKGSTLTAKARCISRGKKLSVYRIDVSDDAGVYVALMTGNAYTVESGK